MLFSEQELQDMRDGVEYRVHALSHAYNLGLISETGKEALTRLIALEAKLTAALRSL